MPRGKKGSRTPVERLLARFRLLEPNAVRITAYPAGTIQEEIQLKDGQWRSAVWCEQELSRHKSVDKKSRPIRRAKARLGKDIQDVSELSKVEYNAVSKSQKQWNNYVRTEACKRDLPSCFRGLPPRETEETKKAQA